jgi:hypothetical protein
MSAAIAGNPAKPSAAALPEAPVYAAEELEETATLFLPRRQAPHRRVDAAQLEEPKSTFGLDI